MVRLLSSLRAVLMMGVVIRVYRVMEIALNQAQHSFKFEFRIFDTMLSHVCHIHIYIYSALYRIF